jgi:hypothetical protein
MHLITEPVHVHPCSNWPWRAVMRPTELHNNAAQAIAEPPPCFTVGSRAFRIVPDCRLPWVFPKRKLFMICGTEWKTTHLTIIKRTFPIFWCPGFMVATPSFTHLSSNFNNLRFSKFQPYRGWWICETRVGQLLWKQVHQNEYWFLVSPVL